MNKNELLTSLSGYAESLKVKLAQTTNPLEYIALNSKINTIKENVEFIYEKLDEVKPVEKEKEPSKKEGK